MSALEQDVATDIKSSEPTLRETIETAYNEARERDEKGRFKAKDEQLITSEETQARVDSSESGKELDAKATENSEQSNEKVDVSNGSQYNEVQPAATTVNAAPASWSNKAKAKWVALDPEVQQEISKRELDMTRGMTRMDEERQFAKSMAQVITPYQALIQSEGSNAPQYVNQLLNTVYTLRTAPQHVKEQVWGQLAQQFGLTSVAQPSADPQLNPVYQRVSQLEAQLQQQQQESQQRQQAELQAQNAQALTMIDTFSRDPAHKYFESVKTMMGTLMSSGEAKDMQEAYDMAINARPDIRAQLQAEEKAKLQAEQDRQRKAQEARLKGSSVRGGPGGIQPTTNTNRTLREELQAAMEDSRSRI